MAIVYTWNCRTVDTYPTSSDQQEPANVENDVIHTVHYSLNGTETVDGVDYTSNVIGTETLAVDNYSNFTSFADLTHDSVIGFVTASLINVTPGRVDELKANVSSSIASQITPSTVTKYIVDAVVEEGE